MNLNYLAFFLISFVPLIVAWIWFHPKLKMSQKAGIKLNSFSDLNFIQIFLLWILSFSIVYGYINIIIHQMGFYELFFTDIVTGNLESKQVVEDFLSVYGDKHRHFGHGVFHGAINAFVFAIPFIGLQAIFDGRKFKYLMVYFGYWMITSILIGGLISEFV